MRRIRFLHVTVIVLVAVAVAPAVGPGSAAAAPGSGAFESAVRADNPIAYFPMDEASGKTAHDVIHGLNGVIENAVTEFSGGIVDYGTGFTFGGGPCDGINLDHVAASFHPAKFSVESWVDPDLAPTSGVVFRDRYYGIALVASDPVTGKPEVTAYTGASTYQIVAGPASIRDGIFHHIVATFDGKNLSLYIDGAKVASSPLHGNVFYRKSQVGIGRDGDACDDRIPSFSGRMDGLAFYDHALTGAEVKTHYAAVITKPASCCPAGATGAQSIDSCTVTPVALVPPASAIAEVNVRCVFDPHRYSANHQDRPPQARWVKWNGEVYRDDGGVGSLVSLKTGATVLVNSTQLPWAPTLHVGFVPHCTNADHLADFYVVSRIGVDWVEPGGSDQSVVRWDYTPWVRSADVTLACS